MNDDKRNEELRRKKVENFRVQIPEDSFSEGQESRGREPSVLNSYSDPQKKRRAPDVRTAERNAAKRATQAHKQRNKQKRGRNKLFFRLVWLMMVLFIGIALAQYAVAGINDMLAIGRDKVNVTVEIPKGATTDQIAEVLQEQGVIQRADFFKLYSKLTKSDGHYNNGTYKLNTSMDYEAIINNLQSNANRVDIVKITFPEGVNALEVAQLFTLLAVKDVCLCNRIVSALNQNGFRAVLNVLNRYKTVFDLGQEVSRDLERKKVYDVVGVLGVCSLKSLFYGVRYLVDVKVNYFSVSFNDFIHVFLLPQFKCLLSAQPERTAGRCRQIYLTVLR